MASKSISIYVNSWYSGSTFCEAASKGGTSNTWIWVCLIQEKKASGSLEDLSAKAEQCWVSHMTDNLIP